MKNKLIFTLFLSILINYGVHAQDYINSVGFRGGLSQGITYKHFVTTTDAVDGILAMRWGGFNITGLYERHIEAFDVEYLYFFYGGGAHIGFWDGDSNPWFDENRGYTVIGIDGVIGLEYVFREIPFNIALDWKPGLNLIGTTGFWGDELALSFRFIF
ncbi:MAG: hypothetical protein ACOCWA_05440 [Bacteroidota bacterium]